MTTTTRQAKPKRAGAVDPDVSLGTVTSSPSPKTAGCLACVTEAATLPPAKSPPTPPSGQKPASDVLAGAIARAASQSTIHPIDTLKVRMQSGIGSGFSKFSKLVPPPGGSIADVMARVGPKVPGKIATLYRGVWGAASGAGIAIGAYFACYGVAHNAIAAAFPELSNGGIAFCAGAVAAAGSSVVKVPIAVCIRSVQAGRYRNAFHAGSSIVRVTGPAGLFSGFLPTVLEDVPDMAVKFAVYESLRQLHNQLMRRKATPQEDFAMGATAGALAAASTTPLDSIKTYMMVNATERPSMLAAGRMLIRDQGMKGLFVGVGPRAMSNGINSAVFFCFFEALSRHLKERTARLEAQKQADQIRIARERTLATMPTLPTSSSTTRGTSRFTSSGLTSSTSTTEPLVATACLTMAWDLWARHQGESEEMVGVPRLASLKRMSVGTLD